MKCPKCGLVQSRQARCKRCGNPLGGDVRPSAPLRAPAAPLGGENPYAPPIASPANPAIAAMAVGAGSEIYRDGELIVARDGASFPDRCVRCNDSAGGFRVKKTFYWHPPSWYLLVLLSVLIYAVVAMVVRKKASFELALCPQHRKRRRNLIGIGLALPVLALVVVILSEGDPASVYFLIMGFLVGIVLAIVGAQILSPKKIEDGYAYLKGARPQFLSSLPALPFR
jgi:hypothetical protein